MVTTVGAVKGRLGGIEALRAYAAVSVILFHLIGSGGLTVPEQLVFIGSHFGQGVPLFFVVSGFSLAYGYLGKLGDEQQVSHYFRRRFFRIAPLFYTALVFQLVYLWLCYGVTFNWSDIALNATFLFNFVPRLTDGIVPASWTIGVEMLFYAMLPVVLLWCKNLPRSILALLLTVLVAGRFGLDAEAFVDKAPSFVYHNVVKNLPLFVWGIVGYHIYAAVEPRIPQGGRRYCGWLIVALGIGGLFLLYHWQGLYMWFQLRGIRSAWDTFWGLPFAALCIALAIYPTRILSNPLSNYLGKISFSIYIVHANILYELGRTGTFTKVLTLVPNSPVLGYFLCFGLSMAIIVPIAALTFRYIERPGMRVGAQVAHQPK